MDLAEAIAGVETLENWVKGHVDEWRDFYRTNYQTKDEEYQRLFRGVWTEEDRTRKSERSRLISPATLQAVESASAEIEEAVFGRGKFFDIEDDTGDIETDDVVKLRNKLHEDFNELAFKAKIREVILTSAMYGNGMAELITEEVVDRTPATRPAMGGAMTAIGVETKTKVIVDIISTAPRNFLIDPAATTIKNALGVATDRNVSPHQIQILQEKGVYLDTEAPIMDIGNETDADADPDLPAPPKEESRLVKYFGLVPRHLLDEVTLTDQQKDAKLDKPEGSEDTSDSFYVEAVVVMMHDGTLLKAEANPYLMQDRDVLNFTWDTLPGMFRGRGVAEKGWNTQKALDVELRGRADAMAMTIHPMLAMDASRMPRGMRPEVRPGKVLPVHGNPRDILMPFNFGNVSEITFPQQQALESMHQRATGAVDITPSGVQGSTPAAALSMSTGAVVKRFKRTQTNFEEGFLIPLIRKVSWRKMQFDPENYPVKDYKFVVRGSLGTIAREFEVAQLSQVMQAIDEKSPIFTPVLKAVIDHMNVSNREQFVKTIDEANKPDPEEQKRKQAKFQAEMDFQAAQTAAFNGTAAESNARAENYTQQASVVTDELQLKMLEITLKYQDDLEPGFRQQLEILKKGLEERKQNTAEFNAETQRIGVRNAASTST